MANRAKHAFGMLENVDNAISSGVIDAFDILFVKDADGKPYVGWIDKEGNKVIAQGKTQVVRVTELPTANGDENVVYVYNNEGYIWDATNNKCVPMSKSADLTALESQVAELETQVSNKVGAEDVDAKIATALEGFETNTKYNVRYLVSSKPEGTLVDYRENEIRIMCPVDTAWKLQTSGENADKNSYYIGVKIYAVSDEVVSFKEDLAQTISDDTMYYFVDNEFAGEDENGKYSIVWLPVAHYDETNGTWTYYGANSQDGKYIGWYYSVNWYDVNSKIVATDCIRINLANENCYSTIDPFYVSNAIQTAKTYTDKQIETKIMELSTVEVVEF